jgi:hypothetical protein
MLLGWSGGLFFSANVVERVKRHRDGLRAAGLRPVQIWVPDTRRPGFAEECRRQSRLLRDDPHEREILDWIEAVADTEGWT